LPSTNHQTKSIMTCCVADLSSEATSATTQDCCMQPVQKQMQPKDLGCHTGPPHARGHALPQTHRYKRMPSKVDVGLAHPKSSAGTCACRRPDKCQSAAGPCSSVRRRAWSGHSARAPGPAVRALVEDSLALVCGAQLPRVVLHEGVLALGALLVHLARLAPRQPPPRACPGTRGRPRRGPPAGERTVARVRPCCCSSCSTSSSLLSCLTSGSRLKRRRYSCAALTSALQAVGGPPWQRRRQRTMMSVRLTIFTSCSSASRSHRAELRSRAGGEEEDIALPVYAAPHLAGSSANRTEGSARRPAQRPGAAVRPSWGRTGSRGRRPSTAGHKQLAGPVHCSCAGITSAKCNVWAYGLSAWNRKQGCQGSQSQRKLVKCTQAAGVSLGHARAQPVYTGVPPHTTAESSAARVQGKSY